MTDTMPKKPGYLEPYSDEQMVFEALLMYSNHRQEFARVLSLADYKTSQGNTPTKEEISYAYQMAEQADRLLGYAKEKLESPIIRLH